MKRKSTDGGSSLSPSSCQRRRLWQGCHIGFIFAAILVALSLSASADAKPGYKVHPGGLELTLPVEMRDGSIISVSANGRQRVRFTIQSPSSVIEYSTKGRVSSRRITADFGALGRIDVKLHLPHRANPPHRGRCKGRPPLWWEGIYRGAIEFARKPGVPEVSAKGGPAYVVRRFRHVCKRRRPRPRKSNLYAKLKRKLEEGILTVRGKTDGRNVQLHATIAFRRSPAYSGGTLNIVASERREGVRITRRIGVFFYHNSLVMSRSGEEPETIKVNLPSPFTGQALYSRSLGSPASWTGDLSVDRPGADGVSLAGAGFTAALCRGKVDSCLYGSGSTPSP
jgi:hypothetical protein